MALKWPTESTKENTDNPYNSSTHKGIDILPLKSGVEGDKVYAVANGTVEKIFDWQGGTDGNNALGHCVYIAHTSTDTGGTKYLRSRYQHLQYTPSVSKGDTVKKGDIIGYMGKSGEVYGSTGVHLHYGLQEKSSAFTDGTYEPSGSSWVNPKSYSYD